jgi:hypothetical protein
MRRERKIEKHSINCSILSTGNSNEKKPHNYIEVGGINAAIRAFLPSLPSFSIIAFFFSYSSSLSPSKI